MTTEIILQAVVTGLMMGLIYALIAAGLSLIFGLMDIVNFAHGEHLMLSMFSSFWLWSLFGLDPIFSIPITILLMAFCGVLTHYFLIRYILKAKMLIQICATFGLSIFIRSIAQFLWTPDFRNIDKPLLEGRLEISGIFIGQPQLIASLVCLVAFILLYLFVTKTETGLALQATAQDRHAAEILGIPSDKMFAIGWAIGLGCVGVAGGMMANYFFIFTDVGINFALFAFVAVALGGFGSIIGCLYAGIIIGLVESLGGLLIDPSFKLLYKQDTIPQADVTIKAIGYQWYWGYEYPDEKIGFDSYMVEEKDLKANQPRLLTVDNEVYVPVNKVIKVMITANDVLHAWALPSFGVKRDAVPGRINETWFRADRTGTYYGQCSELCGIKHAFMLITVNVVIDEEYVKWLEDAKQNFSVEDTTTKNNKTKK